MIAVLIVLFGAALVIGAIIGLRLPAFLALIGAALIVVSITPSDARLRAAARPEARIVGAYDAETKQISLTPATTRLGSTKEDLLVFDAAGKPLPGVAKYGAGKGTLIFQGDVPPATGAWLVPENEWANAKKAARANPGEVVARGFGDTTAKLGLLVALASVIGACLLESGGAERIVLAMRGALGERNAALSFIPSGFLLCIPSFFDTVFYLLMPIGKALRRKTGRDYLLYILCSVAGATMAQALVPPTPGPLFVANALQIPIATMMLGGTIIGLWSAFCGYLYALWANRRWDIPLPAEDAAEMAEAPRELPALGWSILPIVLPISLIAIKSLTDRPGVEGPWWRDWISLVGNNDMALALGTAVALTLLASTKNWKWRTLAKPLHHALESAGTILLITPAGGAFGFALRATDVSGVLSAWFTGSGAWLLPAAFGVTVLVRLCQGSATVAMITAVGIVAPLALGVPLGFHPIYLALAIGCGSKPIPWMNDSGFWIISRMTGMSEVQTLKTASAMMAVMGFGGFALTLLGAWLLPLR
jgi:GntP family gluconate:H+ symporter